ncbi:MAG: AI-2E family transporter [Patescibacteria group bacterium]
MPEVLKFEVSWRTFWQIFVFLILILIFYLARNAVGVLVVSIVISMGIDPVVSMLQRKKINRLLGTIFVFLVGLIVLGTIVYFIIPIIIVEAGDFIIYINKIMSAFFGFSLPKSLITNFTVTFDKVLGIISATNVSVTSAVSKVFTQAVLVLSTFIIAFYLSVEKDGPERLLRVILPDAYERGVLTIFTRFKLKVKRCFATQLVLSLLIGTVVGFGLWLLGVKYPLILGLLAAVFEIVPIIGPVIAGAVAFMVAISDSLSLGLYTFAFFFIVQQLENHILIPVIMGKAVKIHPVIVVISLLAGGQVGGFIGILLSVPIAVLASETVVYMAERKSLRPKLGV